MFSLYILMLVTSFAVPYFLLCHPSSVTILPSEHKKRGFSPLVHSTPTAVHGLQFSIWRSCAMNVAVGAATAIYIWGGKAGGLEDGTGVPKWRQGQRHGRESGGRSHLAKMLTLACPTPHPCPSPR